MSIAKRISEMRKQSGISQEKLAELVGVSRQAVTKWESGKANPDTENLLRLAEIFGVSVDELCREDPSIKPLPKINPLVAAAPPLIFVFYLIYAVASGSLEAGALICLFVICFPMSLFVQLFFSAAIKTGDFSMLAGFDSSVEYNVPEVKRYLAGLSYFIGIITIFSAALMALTSAILHSEAFLPVQLFSYVFSYIAGILLMGYRYSDRLFKNPKDAARSKRAFPSAVVLVGMITFSAVSFIAVFELRGMENNSAEVFPAMGMLFLSIIFTLAAYILESRRLKDTEEKTPLFGKAFIVLNLLALAALVLMAIV